MSAYTLAPIPILAGIGIASAIYSASLFLVLRIPFIERHAVYMHRMQLIEGRDLNHPEQFGFAHRQTTPFFITTSDRVRLHAWHVLPIGLYYKNSKQLIQQNRRGPDSDVRETLNFQLLRDDPEARLVLHTHGSSGALAAYCRADTYRALASITPEKIHVLAFDYRGFGLSSGSPTEEGLLIDAQAVFQWATEVAGIPSERIVLFGQSMGSSVAIALARELALQKTTIAGLIITGSFPDIRTMLSEYRTIFGLRVLWPFTSLPSLIAIFTRAMRNKWPNVDRLRDAVEYSPTFNIDIFHAEDDPIVPWYLSNTFFENAVKAASESQVGKEDFMKEKARRKVDLDMGGWYVEWPTPKGSIRQEVLKFGVHDKIMSYPQITMAINRAFHKRDASF